ncbi:MAG TPA: hypothetical protein VM121_02785 [Acidimicrobiales bacterium]|nr:hypothetical protein [Acidimicrobiales bacterium]
MSMRFDATDRNVTTILASVILVVLLGAVAAAFMVDSSDSTSDDRKEKEAAPVDEAERERQAKAAQDAQAVSAANAEALKSITADQDLCKTKYLAAAQARAAEATQHLKEQEEALKRILDQLPAGKAKDSLAAQLPDEFAASNALVTSELRAAEDRCKLAASIYQYTQAETPPPPPG